MRGWGSLLAGGLAAVLAGWGCAPVYTSATVPPAGGSPGPAASAPGGATAAARETDALADVLSRLVWPLATSRASVLSSDYGERPHPSDGRLRFHAGLDLRSPEGTPVYAAAAGRVVRVGRAGAYGNAVVLDHGAGLRSLYGHLSRILVRPGQEVHRGEVVALVGHTGNATGDHLHFELRWRGGTVDPRTVLPALADSDARR